MKISNILLLLITIVSIVFFKQIENIALSLGLSWTISKITPYVILILLGITLSFKIKKINFKHKISKYLFQILVFGLPFSIGFGLNPIYEGDFSKNGESLTIKTIPEDFQNDGLIIATIPNCPFCFEAIDKLKKIKKRNPSLKIEYVVCVKNPIYVQNYKKEINGAFTVRTAMNPDELAKIAGLRFPSFFLMKDKKKIYKWSNDQFGVRAIDELELKIQ